MGYCRSNLRCRLRPPMRHADTCGLHRVGPYVGSVPGGTHVSMGESLSRRSAQVPYEGLAELSGLRLLGYLVVAACRCSLGWTPGVLASACTLLHVIFVRVGGYGRGLRLLPCAYRRLVFDSLGFSVSLPRLGLTTSPRLLCPRGLGSVLPGYFLPAYARVPFP